MLTNLEAHMMRRSTDAQDSKIRDVIHEVMTGYTFRVVHSGGGGRLAIALPTQRQRMRIKRTIGEAIT